MGESTYNKFSNLGSNRIFALEKLMEDCLAKGLIGPTKSLVGNQSNEVDIINFLKNIVLFNFDEEDIIKYSTDQGFDFQNFLNDALCKDKLDYVSLSLLEGFVFVEEVKNNPEELLNKFCDELSKIEVLISEDGVEALKNTSYGLISFLCTFIARNAQYRIKYRKQLQNVASSINRINNARINSKAKEPVEYKGVTIIPYGDNMKVLKEGIQKIMQAINKLPPAFRKQFTRIDHISITDCEAPDDLVVLMYTEKYRTDEKMKSFSSAAEYNKSSNSINFFDIQAFGTVKNILGTLSHELGHALDQDIIYTIGVHFSSHSGMWEKVKKADGNSISDYGDRFITEDFAEFCKEYSECFSTESGKNFLNQLYPNRTRLLEALLDLRMYNPNKPEKISDERKFEIIRMFEGESANVMSLLTSQKEMNQIYALPPKKRIDYVQKMIAKGVTLQFIGAIYQENFIKGMSGEELVQLYHLFDNYLVKQKSTVIYCIVAYGLKNDMIQKERVAEEIRKITPNTQDDEKILKVVNQKIEKGEEVFYDVYMLRNEFSPDVITQLVNSYITGFGSARQL